MPDKECFVICPFGSEGSAIRARSDAIFDGYIKPVAEAEGFRTFRSIEVEGNAPGVITENVIEKLCHADLVIADLTGANPNVYYELALRHATGKPFIMMVEDPNDLLFDVHAFSTIIIRKDFPGGKRTEKEIRQQIRRIAQGNGRLENPVSRLFPQAAKSARVFVWRIAYAQGLAANWLKFQEAAFVDCAMAFDSNRGVPENPGHRQRLAHYVAYKFSQGQVLLGRLFYATVGLDGTFEGWGNFALPGSPPLAIEVTGTVRSENEIEINFSQPGRPLEIAPGITEMIPAFNFTVNFTANGRSLEGRLDHPDYGGPSPLQIGKTTLSEV